MKPPLGLYVEITSATGGRTRWAFDERSAIYRPQGISFSTGRGDGFKTMDLSLSRDIRRDWPDLHLYDNVTVYGADGAVAWEGRVAAQPREVDEGQRIHIQCIGWMAHAKDRVFREIYLDRDLGNWEAATIARRSGLAPFNIWPTDSSIGADKTYGFPSLIQEITGPATTAARGEAWYDSHGVDLGSIYYAGQRITNNVVPATDANWAYWIVLRDLADGTGANNSSGDVAVNNSAISGTVTASAAGRKYADVEFRYDAAGLTTGNTYQFAWTTLAVYGRHGLTKQGPASATEAQGFTASQIIENICQRFCPRISPAGVADTTLVIPHASWRDPISPYDAFLQLNLNHNWGLEVWEGPTLHFTPPDLSQADWIVRMEDRNVHISLQGDSVDDVANGVVVKHQLFDGKPSILMPDTYPQLKSSDPNLDATTHNLDVWTEIDVPFPCSIAQATNIGQVALADFNRPKSPGSIVVQGHIRDRGEAFRQTWRPRAGQTVAVADHPNDRPRLITETSYDHDSNTVTLTVDGTSQSLPAIFERITSALSSKGLS